MGLYFNIIPMRLQQRFQQRSLHVYRINVFDIIVNVIDIKESILNFTELLFTRRDECPESYCQILSVKVCFRVHKNFIFSHNFWICKEKAFVLHMCILPTIPFTTYEYFWHSDLEVSHTFQNISNPDNRFLPGRCRNSYYNTSHMHSL